MGADILDLHNCMICTLQFHCSSPNRAAWLLGSPCRESVP